MLPNILPFQFASVLHGTLFHVFMGILFDTSLLGNNDEGIASVILKPRNVIDSNPFQNPISLIYGGWNRTASDRYNISFVLNSVELISFEIMSYIILEKINLRR